MLDIFLVFMCTSKDFISNSNFELLSVICKSLVSSLLLRIFNSFSHWWPIYKNIKSIRISLSWPDQLNPMHFNLVTLISLSFIHTCCCICKILFILFSSPSFSVVSFSVNLLFSWSNCVFSSLDNDIFFLNFQYKL